jgi:flagellar FliL protein
MATSAPKAATKAGPNATSEAGPAKSNKKILFLVLGIVLLVIAAAGGGAWYFVSANTHQQAGAPKPAPAKPPMFMTLEPFTVNLAMEEGQQQFLQVGMTLQVAGQEQADMLKLYMPQVRSRLLILLSSKKASEILSVEGKKKLAADIVAQLKQPFAAQGPQPQVFDVFFTSFVVQ